MVQHSKKGKTYDALNEVQHVRPVHRPYVISIWIIKNRIKESKIGDSQGIMVNRISPIEDIVNCTLPTRCGEGYFPTTYYSNVFIG